MSQRERSGFTLIETLLVVGIVVVLVAVLVPTLAHLRQKARRSTSNTQLRGIHNTLVNWSYSKARGGPTDWYVGVDSDGNIRPNDEDAGYSGDGSVPAARYWSLLRNNFFTPEYMISPADKLKVPVRKDSNTYPPLTADNFSYAMMALPGSENEKAEWKETQNADAIVLSDRAIGETATDISSLWTETGSGTWSGGVAHNDNSVRFYGTSRMTNTRYGEGSINATDDLFADDPNADDAFLVFEDATTSYSSQ